jgi:hypothetical protein
VLNKLLEKTEKSPFKKYYVKKNNSSGCGYYASPPHPLAFQGKVA